MNKEKSPLPKGLRPEIRRLRSEVRTLAQLVGPNDPTLIDIASRIAAITGDTTDQVLGLFDSKPRYLN
ncbi:MAG: hypothetical protein JOY94_09000 [Methylobacteriaceae bacterium]|nr:hypothetical protein [Methylobacteriaceae bacterium]